MICIFFEGEQYLEAIQEYLQITLQFIEIQTPYGSQGIYMDQKEEILCVVNAGNYNNLNNQQVPKTIAYLLELYHVDGFAMISKVGGINPLLQVGDIVVMDDYLDCTSIYDRSYRAEQIQKIPRYDMQDAFCEPWRAAVYHDLRSKKIGFSRNLFINGVYVCTNGPGFESKMEVQAYRNNGADVVGHYLSPYMYYCRELNIACITVSVVSNSYRSNDLLAEDAVTKRLFVAITNSVIHCFQSEWKDEQKKHWIRNLE